MPLFNHPTFGDIQDYDYYTGVVSSVNYEDDTCEVVVDGAARGISDKGRKYSALIYYHCTNTAGTRDNGAVKGASKGFIRGNKVIVLMKQGSPPTTYVIGHVKGARLCGESAIGDYYLFHAHAGTLTISRFDYAKGKINVVAMKNNSDLYVSGGIANHIYFHLKKFRHNVDGVTRDLYFVATSLWLNPNPFTGWVNFANANPSFPLVNNHGNSKLTMTPQVMIDLTTVNTTVNNGHSYRSEWPNDVWKIMGSGETGDCEDFALTKAKALLDMGYPASALHIEGAMVDGKQEGHAWLVVQTTDGDYALDTVSNTPIENSQLRPYSVGPISNPSTSGTGASSGTSGAPGTTGNTVGLDTEYVARRRQIGSNWAHISPFGWLLNSINQAAPYCCWYIFDPLYNIFYLMDKISLTYPPFWGFDMSETAQPWQPSINFSSDCTRIYTASPYYGIRSYTIDNFTLSLLSTASNTSAGFIGRDGTIVAPEGTYGRQTWVWTAGQVVGTNLRSDGKYHISSIDSHILGTFRFPYTAMVVSRDGYYEYEYRYVEGEYRCEQPIAPDTTTVQRFLKYEDPERPQLVKLFMLTTATYGLVNDIQYQELSISSDVVQQYSTVPQSLWIFQDYVAPYHCYSYNKCLTPLIHVSTSPYQQFDFDSYIAMYDKKYNNYKPDIPNPKNKNGTPYDGSDFISDVTDARYPNPWIYIEANPSVRIEGIIHKRIVSIGDNKKLLWMNGNEWMQDVFSSIAESSIDPILGIAYIPQTDRLNNN